MKINKTLTALIAGASLGLSGQVIAGGTTAGLTITNQTSLSYSVSTTPQAGVSVGASFMVDNRIDMEISDLSGAVTIIPGASSTYTYTLTNSGNKAQVFELDMINSLVTSDSGNLDLSSLTFNLTSDVTTGTLTNDNYLTIPVDKTATYTVTFPTVNTLTDTNDYNLVATAKAVENDSGGLITPHNATDKNEADGSNIGVELNVFAEDESLTATLDVDTAYNGSINILTNATVATARFTHKVGLVDTAGPGISVLVVNDPICTTNNAGYASGVITCTDTGYTPKAIPKALVEYTITATNSGTATATSVVFTQDISQVNGGDIVLESGTLANENTSKGTATIVGDVITINVGDVLKDETVTITFTAIVE